MSKKDIQDIAHYMINIYSGILFHHQKFEEGQLDKIIYVFDCPEFEELRTKYHLVEIAQEGSDFTRAKRVLHYLAPRLTHSPWYDNHIECNALKLLEYSLDKPEQGINCLNKSKILVECCLALGIYARRVSIMPFSPYDFDNHVVTEIYDRTLEKWIMLDPTTDGYFIDKNKTPLSLIEMRNLFSNNDFVTYVHSTDPLTDIEELRTKYLEKNMYICKNLFYFQVDQYSTFGKKDIYLQFVPCNFSLKKQKQANMKYRIDYLSDQHESILNELKEKAIQLEQFQEPTRTSIQSLINKP